MEIKVTKIVSMTSNVEATVNELSINANVRVRNNDAIEGVDSGSVTDSTCVRTYRTIGRTSRFFWNIGYHTS